MKYLTLESTPFSKRKQFGMRYSFVYNRLKSVVDSLPSKDVKIVFGNFNAKVGKELVRRGTTGGIVSMI